jgi:hypothetical protein
MSMAATLFLSKSGCQELPGDGQGLPYAAEELNAIAREAGFRPISEFFDDSAMLTEKDYEDLGRQPTGPRWFAAKEGLRTLDALIADLEGRDPQATLAEGWRRLTVEEILADLRASRLILARAATAGEQFRYDLG